MTHSIHTIGYQALGPDELEQALVALGIERLMDVRSAPFSKKPGFGKKELEARFRGLYEWRGDTLGGKGEGIHAYALKWLASHRERIMLMCMEADPCRCHRYWLIGRGLLDLGVECVHVQGSTEVTTSELLQRCGEIPPWERQGRLGFT